MKRGFFVFSSVICWISGTSSSITSSFFFKTLIFPLLNSAKMSDLNSIFSSFSYAFSASISDYYFSGSSSFLSIHRSSKIISYFYFYLFFCFCLPKFLFAFFSRIIRKISSSLSPSSCPVKFKTLSFWFTSCLVSTCNFFLRWSFDLYPKSLIYFFGSSIRSKFSSLSTFFSTTSVFYGFYYFFIYPFVIIFSLCSFHF